MDTASLVASLYALSGLVALGIAAWVLRRPSRPGATAFVGMLTVVACWALVDAVSVLQPGLFEKILWKTAGSILAAFIPVLWLLFTLQYTGRFTAYLRSIAAALGLVVTTAAALILTNDGQWSLATPLGGVPIDGHWLFWRTYEYHIEPFPVLEPVPGPAYVAFIGLAYATVIVGALFLLQVVATARDAHRSQPALLVAAIVAALAFNAGSALGWLPVTGLDYTPIGIVLASAIVGWALYRHRLFDVYPVAGDAVMRSIRDAVIVVTEDNLVADYNPAGRRLLAPAAPLSRPVADAIPFDLDRELYAVPPQSAELTAAVDGGRRHFLVDTSSLDDHRQHGGAVLIFRDVTEQRRQQRELERQAEHMERFASSVSHDLRNPLNVAQGGVELLPDDADGTDLIVQSHDRMQTIIEDSLAFARSGQRVTDDDLEPVPLERVARIAWGTVHTNDATLAVEGSERVLADERRLRRLFENLYRNTIDHGGDDVAVRVTALSAECCGSAGSGTGPEGRGVATDGRPGFAVMDDGPGIPPDEREAVLERGYTTRKDGTGFGLAIVTAIAHSHDWDVRVTESDRGGARFEFRNCQFVE